jgi:ubiquinone/menaquinone biosynthesis C-methylase UbiE
VDSLDAAAESLAMQVTETAGIGSHDTVLDVGCGFAEHDMQWAARCTPNYLIVINISYEQLDMVARLHPRRAFAGVCLLAADAVRLPFADASFDAVLGVESAFHFLTRKAFFKEALRVLKPGGRPALADLCGVDRRLAPGTAWRTHRAFVLANSEGKPGAEGRVCATAITCTAAR